MGVQGSGAKVTWGAVRRAATVATGSLLAVCLVGAWLVPAAAGETGDAGGYETYVALGDSYSAGPLIPAQRAVDLGCLRSTNNYPSYLASYFDVEEFVDVTCSGARSRDMWHRQETIVPGPPPPPQFSALTPETDLVTVGIGGNDFGLFGSMISTCQEVRSQNPQGAPCRRHFTVDGVDTKKRDARRIRRHVARVVRGVHRRAPEAEVYVVGYPRLLPTRGTCAAVPFAKGDYRWGNQVERILNRSLRRAARNNGAHYIDLYPASKGHDACQGKQAWVNGAKIKPLGAAHFHPFRRGMRGAARTAYQQITGEKAPTAPFALPPAAPTVPQTALPVADLVGLAEHLLEAVAVPVP